MNKATAVLLGSTLVLSLVGCSTPKFGADGIDAPSAEAHVQKESAPLPLEIVESGWSVNPEGYVTYAAVVRNPNSEWRCETPSLDVLLKDDEGKILERFRDDPLVIEADSEIVLAGVVGNDRKGVTGVDFSMGSAGSWSAAVPVEDGLYSITEPVRGPSLVNTWPDESFRGNVTRNHYVATEGTDAVLVAVIARNADGAIVGGASGVMESLPPHKAVPFEVPCFVPQGDAVSYEAYARPSPKIMA